MSDDFEKMSDKNLRSVPPLPRAEELIRSVQGLVATPLPEHIRERAVTLLGDTLAVGVAGAVTNESQAARAVATQWGGPPEASIWGGGPLIGAPQAAFVNAHQVHSLEWDPIHEPAVVHAMTVVTPTLLAWAARQTRQGHAVSGADILRGIVAGVEVAGALGVATTTPLRFFRPATAGSLGAVVAIGVAAGETPDRILSAFGIAYGGISGTMQPHTEGAQVLALQVGFNARNALCAWDLTEAGFTGPKFVLEGKYGYFRLIEEDGDLDRLLSERGNIWEVERTSIKPFPSGRATHGALDGLIQLQRQHGFTRADVSSIDIKVPPMVFGLVGRRPTLDMQVGAARLCLAYLVPCLLEDGTIDVDTYREDRLRDPALIKWTERVNVSADNNPDPNAFNPQTIIVHLTSGADLSITMPYSLGSAEYPLTALQQREKFDRAMAIGGRTEFASELFDYVARIDNYSDLSRLWEIL
jgi:aconitate decarboxylase